MENGRDDSRGKLTVTGVSLSVSLSWAQRSGFSAREGGPALTAFSRVWGPAQSLPGVAVGCRLERETALGEFGAARREERASSGQAKALRTCGWGAFSAPQAPTPQSTGPRPRAAPVDAALPTHPRHTRAPARTHIQEVDAMEWVGIPLLLKSARGRCGY